MGLALSYIREGWPPETTFTADDIPDLTGKVIIVTGANVGIGKETAKAALARNAKVYIAARSQEKAMQAIRELEDQTGHRAEFLMLDLSDLVSIKASAKEFLSKEPELHILFNNAGVMRTPHEMLTKQGHDLQFGTNVLGHFYFTKLLLPALLAATNSSPAGTVRVVTTSSWGHWLSEIDFNTLKDGPGRNKISTGTLYSQSKFGNIVFAKELARRYGDLGIVSTSLNPGNIHSDLFRHVPKLAADLFALTTHPPYKGAWTQLFAGTAPEAANLNGEYLVPWARIGTSSAASQDPGLGRDLWEWMEQQVETY